MELTPAQSQIVRDSHRFRVVNCGRQFGKTTVAVEEMIASAVSKNDLVICYVAPTFQQARDIAWAMLVKRLEPVLIKANETRLELTVKTQFGKESRIILRGWESIETLRGQKFHFIVVDEVAMMRNFWTGWQEVLRPTLTHTQGQVLFISTPKGFNHFYDLYNTRDPDFQSFHFTTYDNPYAPVSEIEAAQRLLPSDRFQQEYLASFQKREGLVYNEFDRQRHVYGDEVKIRATDKIAGIDFGFTNPACVLTILKDFDRHYWVSQEWYKTGQTDAKIAEYVSAQGFNRVYPDH